LKWIALTTPALAAGGARFVGRGEVHVAAPSPRHDRGVGGVPQVGQLGAALVVVDDGPRRDAQDEIGAARTVLVLAPSRLAALGAKRPRVGEVEEGGQTGIDPQDDVPAVTPVAAVPARPAARTSRAGS
jgi:hypothetical protein